MIDFFHFWGYRFNYENMGISITNGGGLFKKNKQDQNLSLIDPIDSNVDVGKRVFNFHLVKKAFQSAFKVSCCYFMLKSISVIFDFT